MFEEFWAKLKEDSFWKARQREFPSTKEQLAAVWNDAQQLAIAKAVFMLANEAKDLKKQGKELNAQNVQYCATMVAEMQC